MGPTLISSAVAARARTIARPAQDGADARHQLARIEGLAQIVVGAELEADDAVDVVAACGQHEDRRVVAGAERAQDIEAADARQHHIENQNLEIVGLELVERIAAVVHALDLEMFGAQVFAEHLTKLAIVIHQQHARLARCRARIGLVERACHIFGFRHVPSVPPSSGLVNELTILCMQPTQNCVSTRFAAGV